MIMVTAEQLDRMNVILNCIPGATKKAWKSVIKRANQTVRSETTKQISKIYAISQKDIRAETNISIKTKTNGDDVVGEVEFSGYKIPLYRFNVTPKTVKHGATIKAAQLKSSQQTVFEHAFIAMMKSGHIGMFERKSKKPFPIKEFMGSSTAQMAANTVVVEKVEEKAKETIDKRIEHEISRILNSY